MLALLFGTHLYFTFHLGFIQKKIPLGIRLSLTGTKNQEKDQVTPYSALATALAATIGTGNMWEFPQPLPSADQERYSGAG